MNAQQFVQWEPNPATLAADLEEFREIASDDWRRLYLNEFCPPEPIEVSPAQYHELVTARSYHLPGRREYRTDRTGDRRMWLDGRPVIVVHAAGGSGSDDDGSDDDRAPKALRYRPAHGGRLPAPVSIH